MSLSDDDYDGGRILTHLLLPQFKGLEEAVEENQHPVQGH